MSRTIYPTPDLESLRVADPDTYHRVYERLISLQLLPPPHMLKLLAAETIWGLSQDRGLGNAVADTLLKLLSNNREADTQTFIRIVHQASTTGVTLARILAIHLGPVLLAGGNFLDKFQKTVAIMQMKGTYTLNAPLAQLTNLLSADETVAADHYLDLLAAVFRRPMSYNLSQRMVYQIPRAVKEFPIQRRSAQIRQFHRIAEHDLDLIDPFLEGMQKGVFLLPERHLIGFIDQALTRWRRNPKAGKNFLSLISTAGQETCNALQVTAPLDRIHHRLSRYLNARLGRHISIKPLSTIGDAIANSDTWICSDGQYIFIKEEIQRYDAYIQNVDLYMTLIRLEAGFFECGSFTFDLERAGHLFPKVDQWIKDRLRSTMIVQGCDAQRFFSSFSHPALAEDLFVLLDMARVSSWMTAHYPGLQRRIHSDLNNEINRLLETGEWDHPLAVAFIRLNYPFRFNVTHESDQDIVAEILQRFFTERINNDSPVESCADIMCHAFEKIQKHIINPDKVYRSLPMPFGRRLKWNLIGAALQKHAAAGEKIRINLAKKGLKVYRSDLQYQLLNHQGKLSAQDIRNLIGADVRDAASGDLLLDLSDETLAALLDRGIIETDVAAETDKKTYFYPEWDFQLQDYLQNYTRVQEISLRPSEGSSFYADTLSRLRGLVSHTRHAFEWLKPEGFAMLRQWPEGDAFDYRALIDFLVDRRTGRIPSDRLYIKRLKRERDVAVMLLVDMSRSTANPVAGRPTRVLDLTKESLVLFCEALEVVGDPYALTGFSGTGRHSVDFFMIKKFEESLNHEVRERIGTLTPQRGTRMGAAIRHAVYILSQMSARVRLLIIISDGFPNDLGYKAEYAIADTRKAIQEARFKSLYVKALTVNIGSDPRLDDLYGRSHSHVIEDVEALPGQLLGLYSTLTRPN